MRRERVAGPRRHDAVRNDAMSVDLEDWFCVLTLDEVIGRERWNRCESRVVRSTERLLAVFDEHRVRATFFVLGWIAERQPDLIRTIGAAGHELACHGYDHVPAPSLGADGFRDDIRRALDMTAPLTSAPIRGFRAPAFSITPETPWALDILREEGFAYDSSFFPSSLHPRFSMPDSPLVPFRLDNGLVEVPVTCARIGPLRVPCAGGAYFRLAPYWLTHHLIRCARRQGTPLVFYVHPWEIDPDQPRLRVRPTSAVRHYTNLGRTLERLHRLLAERSFSTVAELAALA